MNAYVDKLYGSEKVRTYTKLLHASLDVKYEKADLNKVIKNQCQHLTEEKINKLLKVLQKYEDLLNVMLGTW